MLGCTPSTLMVKPRAVSLLSSLDQLRTGKRRGSGLCSLFNPLTLFWELAEDWVCASFRPDSRGELLSTPRLVLLALLFARCFSVPLTLTGRLNVEGEREGWATAQMKLSILRERREATGSEMT